MKYYPVYLNLQGRRVLIVGAGEVAWQKIPNLLEANARLVVVSPEALPEVQQAAEAGHLELRRRGYQTADIEGAELVIAATDAPELQQRVAAEARARGIWV